METPKRRLQTTHQADRFSSPWPLRVRVKLALWRIAWLTLFRPTPKPLYLWRLLLLRLFGAKVRGRPFIASSAAIQTPWQLDIEDRACVGPHAVIYNLGRVVLKARCVVAQECYLCGGTHDFSNPSLPLVTGDILIGRDAFVGARAFILPGVTIGDGAVVGACSVVAADVPPWTIAAGNPCRSIRPRIYKSP